MIDLYRNGLPNVLPRDLWTNFPTVKQHNVLEVLTKTFAHDNDGFPTEEGWKDLSKILSIYSDRRYETARYLLVKDGKINEQISVSSQTPTFSIVSPHDWMLSKLRIYSQRTDSKLLFVHNHPSGIILPSEDDKKLTRYLSNYFVDDNMKPRFLGHAIIGYNNDAAIYSDKDKDWKVVSNNKIIPCEQFTYTPLNNNMPTVMGSLGILILADYSTAINENATWNTDKWVPGFYINRNKQVTAIQYFHSEDFYTMQSQNIPKILRNSARKTGSESVIFIMPKNDHHLFGQIEYLAQQTHMVNDIYHPTDNGYETIDEYLAGGKIFHPDDKIVLEIMDSRSIKRKMNDIKKTISNDNKKSIIRGINDESFVRF